ncbi:MAG: ATP-binding cassette domain-containing protein [Candidatus Spyradosoma sp.]
MTETATVEDAVVVRKLCKNYGSHKAVSGVSFSVKRGEIVGFLGPNGAGKSTTMRILAGLTPANSGIARICGIPVSTDAFRAKAHLGYMPENNPLPEELRVIEYLRWRARLKDVPEKRLRERVESVMAACDLARKARRKLIGSLSKGFRQRVGIADALLSEPDVVILDEPTIGLDPHQILGIRSLIRGLRGKKAVLISSHILPEIENVCDRVIIINQGHVVAAGTPEELRAEFVRSRAFEIVSDAAPERVAEVLGALSVERVPATATEPSRLLARIPADAPREDFLEKLHFSGIRVEEFSEKRASLEDIFIAATKRNYDVVDDVSKRQ